jgi:hypothetical protein
MRSDLSLGERCVEWCMRQKDAELRPSTDTLRVWFAECIRNRKPLGLVITDVNRPNHCAAAQSFAVLQSMLPGETPPHRPRAAAKELMADAIDAGAWVPRADVLKGWRPRTGDLAIYDRSKPGKPETQWWGHVDRVVENLGDRYRNIGANEGARGEWVDQVTRYDYERLLGFVSYPPLGITDEDRAHVMGLVALTLAEAERPWDDDQGRREMPTLPDTGRNT